MTYTLATASVTGHTHLKLGYNNQDAYEFYQDQDLTIGVVADGCGSGANSEVGAKLGVNFAINFCRQHFRATPFDVTQLKAGLLTYLRQLVSIQQSKEELEFIEQHLFFTLFGFVIQKEETYVFHSGDGLYILNDQVQIIEQNNRPEYIAKGLIGGHVNMDTARIPTTELSRLLVATDGLMHLDEAIAQGHQYTNLPSLEALFEQADYFDNMTALPKHMTHLAKEKQILRDDTTLIMLKVI